MEQAARILDAAPHFCASAAEPMRIDRLTLSDFRNHSAAVLETGPGCIALIGPNGAGKTNVLEAVSLLAPGNGLRRAPLAELARTDGSGAWAVAARIWGREGCANIGTGIAAGRTTPGETPRTRTVRIDGVTHGAASALAAHLEILWLTPAYDGLFTGPASERRHFLDRLAACFDPSHRARGSTFERAMKNRNRLLTDGVRDGAQFAGLESVMAEAGVAIAAARSEAIAALQAAIHARRIQDPASPFPWADLAVEGDLESGLALNPAVEVEEGYLRTLRDTRERDRAAGRTLNGPHRSDFLVRHGPKSAPARTCSTGEQKALLLGVVLAQAELMAAREGGRAPILLLDEVTAHLDDARRAALFSTIQKIGAQAWMTGTDRSLFSGLGGCADFWRIDGDGAAKWP